MCCSPSSYGLLFPFSLPRYGLAPTVPSPRSDGRLREIFVRLASTAAKVIVLNTADNSSVGVINPGDEPNAADGYAPTGIALTATPTAGS